jgi:hypothetical protein
VIRREVAWPAGAALMLAPFAGVLTAFAPLVGVISAVGIAGMTLAVVFPSRLPRVFLGVLGLVLFGYTFLGKGFAYLGFAPVFIGECVLLLGLLAIVLGGGIGPAFRSPITWLLCAYALWGMARTVPYLSTYKFEALRDAIIWGYGAFTLLVAGFLLRTRATQDVPRIYGRWFWWFGFWSPIAGVIFRMAEPSIPRVPGTEDIPILFVKAGDYAVQLAGVAAFVLVGLAEQQWRAMKHRALLEWAWWMAWLGGVAISGAASRSGLLTVFVAVATVLLLKPRSRWLKPAIVSVVFAIAFVASDLKIDAGQNREVSARQIAANVQSIVTGQARTGNLDETRAWRLQWWQDIIDYTVHGTYFWTGKGFGVNLADDDGYQGTDRGIPNRHPHNIQLTVLAHAGVPGLVLWVALQLTFFFSFLQAYYRARRARQKGWARVNLWILAFWMAFMANASFDVFIEGPQGGIWFWCLLGFGIAVLEEQKRERRVAVGHKVLVHPTARVHAPQRVPA